MKGSRFNGFELLVLEALRATEQLPVPLEGDELYDFVVAYNPKILQMAERRTKEFVKSTIARVRQGEPHETPILLYDVTKLGVRYIPRPLQTADHKNRYLVRMNKTMVRLREKAKVTRDAIEVAGDRAAPLFIVGRPIDDEALTVLRVHQITWAQLELLYPEWVHQDEFDGGEEDGLDGEDL